MAKPIIGVIAQPDGFECANTFRPRYYILNNYSKVIENNGGIPIGILMNDLDIIEDNLKLCDGFLITGGIKIENYHLKVIDYAMKYNKPLLGICMGMQALAMHSLHTTHEKLVLKNVRNHDSKNHAVYINNQDSHIYQIFNEELLLVNSYHNYQVTKIGDNYEICGYSSDGIPEIIEYKDKNKFIMGVQWHPELMSSMQPLIQKFIEEAGKKYENKY